MARRVQDWLRQAERGLWIWGAPMDYFEKKDAEKAIRDAKKIINFAKAKVSG